MLIQFKVQRAALSSIFVFHISIACETEFSVILNTEVAEAIPYVIIDTLEACAQLCHDMPECQAFDFDHNNQPHESTRCWIHQSSNLDTKDKQAVNHYKKNTCSLEPGQLIFYLF